MKIKQEAAERHVLTITVDNEAGILAKIAGLFTARGYNIDSLTVADITENHALSRITIVTNGPPAQVDQIRAQLERLEGGRRPQHQHGSDQDDQKLHPDIATEGSRRLGIVLPERGSFYLGDGHRAAQVVGPPAGWSKDDLHLVPPAAGMPGVPENLHEHVDVGPERIPRA